MDEDERTLREAIKINPNDAEAHRRLGSLLISLERYKEAEEELRQAIRLKPDFAEAYGTLGSVYDDLGRYEEAVEALRQAIRLKPDYAEAEILLNKLERKISSSKETSSERSSSGCFIATAVYGDENAVELKILRDFRDTVLLRNSLGRLFVSLYYFISPSIANIIKKSEYAKNFVKKVFIEPSLLLVMYIINRKERR
jgi:tetratricopeptide (TPR) repeat protein